MRVSVRLRNATDGDEPFLRDLFAATRPAPMNLPSFRPFAEIQYDARRRSYALQSDDTPLVIESDGRAVGTLWLWVRPAELRLADLAVAPDFQGRGIARAALDYAVSEAERLGVPLRLSVESMNARAIRLYSWRGFQLKNGSATDLTLEFMPSRSRSCGQTE